MPLRRPHAVRPGAWRSCRRSRPSHGLVLLSPASTALSPDRRRHRGVAARPGRLGPGLPCPPQLAAGMPQFVTRRWRVLAGWPPPVWRPGSGRLLNPRWGLPVPPALNGPARPGSRGSNSLHFELLSRRVSGGQRWQTFGRGAGRGPGWPGRRGADFGRRRRHVAGGVLVAPHALPTTPCWSAWQLAIRARLRRLAVSAGAAVAVGWLLSWLP
jgi:hypothetical protein